MRVSTTTVLACLALSSAFSPALPAAGAASLDLPVGESLVYDVRYGIFDVGTARMDVLGVESVRGRAAWHTKLEIGGSVFGFTVHDVLESWIDVETGNSLRFSQESVEGSRQRSRRYEIDPVRGTYQRDGHAAQATVAQPLDEGAFLYFVRRQPLALGQTASFPRYFIPERNPVTVSVVRRERVSVPAGTFDTIVLKPVIRSGGVFSENGRAEIWLSDDEPRRMVQLVTHVTFGTLSLRLREARTQSPQ